MLALPQPKLLLASSCLNDQVSMSVKKGGPSSPLVAPFVSLYLAAGCAGPGGGASARRPRASGGIPGRAPTATLKMIIRAGNQVPRAGRPAVRLQAFASAGGPRPPRIVRAGAGLCVSAGRGVARSRGSADRREMSPPGQRTRQHDAPPHPAARQSKPRPVIAPLAITRGDATTRSRSACRGRRGVPHPAARSVRQTPA